MPTHITTMDFNFQHTSYASTHFFSKIVTDYLHKDKNLQPFYSHLSNLNGIKAAIEERKKFITDRNLLVNYFNSQYAANTSKEQQKNIDLLANANCFTITTAHQPNIFTGPLYFIYKILHTIKLANELNKNLTNCSFVPVYYMGSEDADLEELGSINLQGKKIYWNTQQTGAVGRMKVDNFFLELIAEIQAQLGVNEFGDELINIFKQCYTLNKPIQNATFDLANMLFANYGLLVLIPDNIVLKIAFIPTITKEINTQFSRNAVDITNTGLVKHYKIQAAGRELNLFYLIDDKRERIEIKEGLFIVEKLQLAFTKTEILIELNNYPERFSANVILRPVFQETILPNIAFIGGGGELAYWLQLRNVFKEAGVPYPILVLRNSFLIYTKRQEDKLQKMGSGIKNIFAPAEKLFEELVKKQTNNNLSLQSKIEQARIFYNELEKHAKNIDQSLVAHTQAIATKALQKLETLEKKMLRAEKRKFTDQKNQLLNIKNDLFPNENLQERIENFGYYYSIFGKQFFNIILSSSKGLEQEFGLVCIDK